MNIIIKKESIKFKSLNNKKIELNFKGGSITSNGGGLLLRKIDNKLKLTSSVSKAFEDTRQEGKISHSIEQMLKQRVYAIALGEEDINDQKELRKCLGFQTILNEEKILASPATLSRFENKANRDVAVNIHKIIIDQFISSHKVPPKELILDFDSKDLQIHGNQEGGHYHGYYRHECFLPLHVFCNDQLLVSYLRPSNKDGSYHSWAIFSLLVKILRKSFPKVKLIFRGDCGFCRHRMLNWCDKHNVSYIVGLPGNSVLQKTISPLLKTVEDSYNKTQEKQKEYLDFTYGSKTWKHKRRVIGKAECTRFGLNTRFIVTNLDSSTKHLYEEVYCARGNMENRIKEQLELFSYRISCHNWWPNQFRLILSGLAYILLERIRAVGLKGTKLCKLQVGTIRLKLLKVGAIIFKNTRRIQFLLSSSYPYKSTFASVVKRLDSA